MKYGILYPAIGGAHTQDRIFSMLTKEGVCYMLKINWIIWKVESIVLIVIAAILLMGCSTFTGQSTATEDTAYLTPIPRETLQAYQFQFGSPTEDKMQAVIVSRFILDTTRLSYTETPKVLSAEEVRFEDARRRVAQPGFLRVIHSEEMPGDTKVWLVLFEGDWRMTGPAPEEPITPGPPTHGCVYVIIDANDNGANQFGTTECSP